MPLTAVSLYSTLVELAFEPARFFALLATRVPSGAYQFMAYVFMRAGVSIDEATGAVRAALALAVRSRARTAFARAHLLRPPPGRWAAHAAWDAFVSLVALTYAPIAPITTAVCALYALVALAVARHDALAACAPAFDTRGRAAALGARQALRTVGAAWLLQLGVVGLATVGSGGGVGHVLALLPLVAPIAWTALGIRARQELSLNGRARGRLPLGAAADVDASRPREHVVRLHGYLARTLNVWAPPAAPPLDDDSWGAGSGGPDAELREPAGPPILSAAAAHAEGAAHDERPPLLLECVGELRQHQLQAWMQRYASASAMDYCAPPDGGGGRDPDLADAETLGSIMTTIIDYSTDDDEEQQQELS